MITTVEYRKLVSFGDYSNISIGATYELNSDEDPNEALSTLEKWVAEHLAQRSAHESEIRTTNEELWRKQSELAAYESKLERAKIEWDKASAILKHHGIDVPTERPFDSMPF